MNVYEVLAAPGRSHPEHPWVQLIDPGSGAVVRSVTYGQLDDATARVVGALDGLGVRPGDRVLVQVDASPEAFVTTLGAMRAGAVVVPLNPAYGTDELAHFVTDAAPSLVVRRPASAAVLDPVARAAGVRHVLELSEHGRGSWPDAWQAAAPAPSFPATSDRLAALVYTSGTTGRSKGAMTTHGNLASNAVALHRHWGFVPGDVLLHTLPVFHVHGLFVALHTAVLNASTIRLHPRFDAAAAARDLTDPAAGVTVFMGVPTMYGRLLQQPTFTADRLRHVRLFVSGSAPLTDHTAQEFLARTGHAVHERYGMTETQIITAVRLGEARRAGTVGHPLPGVEVRVVDDERGELPVGNAGHVEVRGPNVMAGYWGQPERTAQDLTLDGWFRTGDVGVLDHTGSLTLVGRSKDLVISGGFNVYPSEVEQVLDALPGVAESAVIGVPHPDLGEAVTAVLVLRPHPTGTPDAGPSEPEVIAAVRSHLAGYKVPRAVRVVPELPRNAMGKVQKNVLRDTFHDLFGGA